MQLQAYNKQQRYCNVLGWEYSRKAWDKITTGMEKDNNNGNNIN